MRTIRFAAAVAAALALVLATAAGPAVAKHRHACRLKGSHTLAHSKRARIFVKKHRYYGCLYRKNRRHRLPVEKRTTAWVSRTVDGFKLARDYVAYRVSRDRGPDESSDCGVHVVLLRNGHQVHHVHLSPPDDDTSPYIPKFVIKPSDGALAYGSHVFGLDGETDHEVVKIDADGRRVLDSQDDSGAPDDRSLTYSSGNAYWTHDNFTGPDETRSAPLR